jgi:hypothetical protein
VLADFLMVSHPGLQASGSKGTAHIDVKTGSKLKQAEFSDFYRKFIGRREDQCVCAGKRMHVRAKKLNKISSELSA